MFSPARLMTTSQRGSPDLMSSLCWRKHRTCWYSSRWRANCPPTHLAEAGRTHVIRPGPGWRETNVTWWPLALSSWVRAVPMNPVPPPDGRAQTVYSPRGGRPGCPFWCRPLGHQASPPTPPPAPAPQCRGDTGLGVSGIRLLGLGSQGWVACLEGPSSWPQPTPARDSPSPPSPTSTRIATGKPTRLREI